MSSPNRSSRLSIACALLPLVLGQTSPSHQIWEPTRIHDSDIPDADASVATEPISRIQIGELSVVLEQTSLSSVQAVLGGEIGRRGDASDSLNWLCYHFVQGDQILWLLSGEVHGDTIGGVLLRELRPEMLVDQRCVGLGASLQLPGGVRTRMRQEEFIATFGRPTVDGPERVYYRYEHDGVTLADGHVDSQFVTTNSLLATFSSGRLSAIEVWRLTVK